MKYAICVIMHYPVKPWLDFLKKIELYDVYVLVDDNVINYQAEYNNEYSNIKFIQIPNNEFLEANFQDLDFAQEIISGWHKALYFFSTKFEHDYDHIWFMEDDVFFNGENTLKRIDIEYPNADLLSQELVENHEGSLSKNWHWYKITMHSEPPFYNTMVCIVRMSRTLLSKIADYARTYKTLFFIEAMFPTLAMQHGLECKTPEALRTIHYRYNFNYHELTKHQIYHPIKNKALHSTIRHYLFLHELLSDVEDELKKMEF